MGYFEDFGSAIDTYAAALKYGTGTGTIYITYLSTYLYHSYIHNINPGCPRG